MDKDNINNIINNKESIQGKINKCDILDSELDLVLGNNDGSKKTILVLSGGGTKGFAHLGAIKAFIELDMFKHFHTFACSSAGGIVGLLITCGFSPEELIRLTIMIGVDKIKSPETSNILSDFGFDSGDRFMLIIEKILKAKGFSKDFTFKDHYKRTGKKLILTGSCINDKKCYYFSVDTYPNMNVLTALRITMSVPLFFTPVKFDGKLFSDGGCVDNYPITLFNDRLHNVIGVYLNSKKDVSDTIDHFEGFIINSIECLLEGVSFNACKGYDKYTIFINVNSAELLNFGLKKDSIYDMVKTGYNYTKKYISTNLQND